MLALLDATEKGTGVGAKSKTRSLPTLAENNEIDDEQVTPDGEGDPLVTRAAEGGGESHGDAAYAHLANFMVGFLHKVDESFRGMREEISQLRSELRPRQPLTPASSPVAPPPAPQVSAPPPAFYHQVSEAHAQQPPASYHQVSEVPARHSSLVPRLANLRQDPVLSRQAGNLVDVLDCQVSGTCYDKYSKQGWARCGGDLASRVPTPWPQDHVIGQGRKSKLFYDDLNIYEWAQGVLAIMEGEDDISTIKQMLAHYRAVFRDANNHGFEAAKWSSGVVLSLLEKGKLTWDQSYHMAEERRSALVASSVPLREHPAAPQPRDTRPSRQNQYNYYGNGSVNANGNRSSNSSYSANSGRKVSKICMFFNNGTCPHPSHHDNGNTRWRHVCKECFESGHAVRDCGVN
jgi:hypothetical protein